MREQIISWVDDIKYPTRLQVAKMLNIAVQIQDKNTMSPTSIGLQIATKKDHLFDEKRALLFCYVNRLMYDS